MDRSSFILAVLLLAAVVRLVMQVGTVRRLRDEAAAHHAQVQAAMRARDREKGNATAEQEKARDLTRRFWELEKRHAEALRARSAMADREIAYLATLTEVRAIASNARNALGATRRRAPAYAALARITTAANDALSAPRVPASVSTFASSGNSAHLTLTPVASKGAA